MLKLALPEPERYSPAMSQNPYGQMGGGLPGAGVGNSDYADALPQRTSVLAIFALILGLICFLPGAGALAVILGGAALVFISQSRGRLSGTGLAASGIVLGLLFSVIWIGVFVGVRQVSSAFGTQFSQPVGQLVAALQNKDHVAARALFTKASDAKITDEMLDEFGAKVQAELGAFKGMPDGPLDFLKTAMSLGPSMQVLQGRGDTIPLPGKFENGNAVIGIVMDMTAAKGGGPGGGVQLPVVNLVIVRASPPGTPIWLIDPALTPPTVGSGVQFKFGPPPPKGGQSPEPPDPPEPPDATAPPK